MSKGKKACKSFIWSTDTFRQEPVVVVVADIESKEH